jgi:hypothetical protein
MTDFLITSSKMPIRQASPARVVDLYSTKGPNPKPATRPIVPDGYMMPKSYKKNVSLPPASVHYSSVTDFNHLRR